MKKYIPVLLILLLCPALLLAFDPERPTERVQGTVVDRAIDYGLPYVGIRTDDGGGMCVYFEDEALLPEDLVIGDRVEVQYRILPMEQGERYLGKEIKILK